MLHFQALESFPLQCLQQLCDEIRPSLHLAWHMRWQEKLQVSLLNLLSRRALSLSLFVSCWTDRTPTSWAACVFILMILSFLAQFVLHIRCPSHSNDSLARYNVHRKLGHWLVNHCRGEPRIKRARGLWQDLGDVLVQHHSFLRRSRLQHICLRAMWFPYLPDSEGIDNIRKVEACVRSLPNLSVSPWAKLCQLV